MPKIHEKIRDLPVPANERATFKGQEIVKSFISSYAGVLKEDGSATLSMPPQKVQFSGADYTIDIRGIRAINNGIEVFARAWLPNGEQIGFGKDGSVDIERFRFINPPILTRDPSGTIEVTIPERFGGGVRKYKEDPLQSLKNSLAHTIKVKNQKFGADKIVRGKVGSTTLIAFPEAGTVTAPIDGEVKRQSVDESFATIRGGAGNGHNDTANLDDIVILDASTTTNQYDRLIRAGAGFDTSSIGSDNVDSGSLSWFLFASDTTLGDTDVDVVGFTPGDGSDFANSDYGNFDTTRRATGRAISSLTANDTTYEAWTLNASGLSYINTGGDTFFGMRLKWDVDNSFTGTWSSGGQTQLGGYYADDTTGGSGTDQDPKLVVEHSEAAAATKFLTLLGVGT